MKTATIPLALMTLIFTGSAWAAEPVRLKLVPQGGSAKIGYYMPIRAVMSEQKPASVVKEPAGLGAPLYGRFPVGPRGADFILDEPDGKPAMLYVDANSNGDFTDDPSTGWKARAIASGSKSTTTHFGSAMIDLAPAGASGGPQLAGINIYRFDKNDPARASYKNILLYYRDYARDGTATIGGKEIHVMLSDDQAKGDFTPKLPDGADEKARSGVRFFADLNGDGKFDRTSETFDAARPFNIGGVTYEIKDMAPDGSAFQIVKSDKVVAEIKPPPPTGIGQVFASFTGVDTAGQPVNFPADFKGKIVLVDFWATWCGPCMAEMPNVVKVYQKHHAAGFEILGISLDNDKTLPKLPEVMKKANMTWRQIADGQGWNAAIAKKFAIHAIPATFLIDGSTGKIIGENLRGEALEEAVAKALGTRGAE